MKISKTSVLRAAGAVLLAAVVCFSLFFGVGKIGEKQKGTAGTVRYKGIINLWHFDMFEGGVGSRAEFLLARAAAFEKKYNGVLVMVTVHTPESAQMRYDEGERPDLVSYGYGFEPLGIMPLESKRSFSYGEYDGECYALPWCRGGYALLSHGEIPEKGVLHNAVISSGEYTCAEAAAALSGWIAADAKTFAPADAYYRYITGAADYLIGTQRDVNRVLTRGAEGSVMPLNGYNDLYQYISVTAQNAEKKYYACRYVDYLLSDEVQNQLDKIGMLSVYTAAPHASSELAAMQNAEFASGISVFTARALYDSLREYAAAALGGEEEALKNLKNLVA